MVYAYDRNIQMPTKDLYDTQIMAMAVAAAKDEYEKAEKRLDDLNKLYGDFYSPSDVDMQNWQTYVVSPIKDKLDELYAKGIDPTRSAEGRAILAKASRDLPYDTINRLKQGAAIGQEYLKNMAKLQAQGLYNPDYEERYLGYDIRNWDTLKNGVWNRYSPDPVPSLQDATVDWYKNRTARTITPEEMQALAAQGYSYDPNMDYTGWLESDALHVAGENVPGFAGTQVGGYYADLARQEVMQRAAAEGRDPKTITQDEVDSQLARNIATANRQFLIAPVGKANPFALADYKAAKSVSAYRQKLAAKAQADGDSPNPYEQSYARDIYTTSLGKIFGDDAYTASYRIEDGSYGKKIFSREREILKHYNFDIDKSIAAHTSYGNYKSNAVMIGIPLGGNVKIGQKTLALSSSSQFAKASLGQKKIYDAADLTFNNAGYSRSKKDRNEQQQQNKKTIGDAQYYTVTDEVVGQYEKNGQYKTYTKVIGDNGSIGYVPLGVNSNRKSAGATFSNGIEDRRQDLGYDKMKITSMKQRDLVATKLYTKQGSSNNNGALEPEMTDEDIDDLDAE